MRTWRRGLVASVSSIVLVLGLNENLITSAYAQVPVGGGPGAAGNSPSWTNALPADWLAVVVLERPLDFVAEAPERLASIGLPARDLSGIRAWFNAFQMENRPLVVGFAEEDEDFRPFALIPGSHETVLDKLDADRGPSEAFASLLGYDLRLEQRGGWTWAAFSSSKLRPLGSPALVPPPIASADLSVHVSGAGLTILTQTARARRGENARRRHPPELELFAPESWLDAAAAAAPLIAAIDKTTTRASIAYGQNEDDHTLDLTMRIAEPASTETPRRDAPPNDRDDSSSVSPETIAWLKTRGVAPPPLAQLVAAGYRCRPDLLGAKEFAAPEFDRLASALNGTLSLINVTHSVWWLPDETTPLTANRVIEFDVIESVDIVTRAIEIVERWNRVVEATDGETALIVRREPLKDGDAKGVRFTTDVADALGADLAEPILPLLERVFGPEGKSTLDLTAISEKRWRLAPPERGSSARADGQPQEKNAGLGRAGVHADQSGEALWRLSGELWIDRWLAWQTTIEQVFEADIVGKKKRPPMEPCPPVAFAATCDPASGVRVQITAPTRTVQAAVRYWRSPKQPSRQGDQE